MIKLGLKGVVLSQQRGYLTIRSEVGSTHKVPIQKSRFTIGDEVFMALDDYDNVIRVSAAVDHVENSPEPIIEYPDEFVEVPELEPLVFGSFIEIPETDN